VLDRGGARCYTEKYRGVRRGVILNEEASVSYCRNRTGDRRHANDHRACVRFTETPDQRRQRCRAERPMHRSGRRSASVVPEPIRLMQKATRLGGQHRRPGTVRFRAFRLGRNSCNLVRGFPRPNRDPAIVHHPSGPAPPAAVAVHRAGPLPTTTADHLRYATWMVSIPSSPRG
jgi:hypothetical protein